MKGLFNIPANSQRRGALGKAPATQLARPAPVFDEGSRRTSQPLTSQHECGIIRALGAPVLSEPLD